MIVVLAVYSFNCSVQRLEKSSAMQPQFIFWGCSSCQKNENGISAGLKSVGYSGLAWPQESLMVLFVALAAP